MKYPLDAVFTVKLGTRTWKHEYPSLPESSYEDVISRREELVHPDQMICRDKFDLCSFTGGKGPVWHFDRETGYFYLRVVTVECYIVLVSLSLSQFTSPPLLFNYAYPLPTQI